MLVTNPQSHWSTSNLKITGDSSSQGRVSDYKRTLNSSLTFHIWLLLRQNSHVTNKLGRSRSQETVGEYRGQVVIYHILYNNLLIPQEWMLPGISFFSQMLIKTWPDPCICSLCSEQFAGHWQDISHFFLNILTDFLKISSSLTRSSLTVISSTQVW